jgi:hypothetical protein
MRALLLALIVALAGVSFGCGEEEKPTVPDKPPVEDKMREGEEKAEEGKEAAEEKMEEGKEAVEDVKKDLGL